MSRTFSAHRANDRCIHSLTENLKEKYRLEELEVDIRKLLKCTMYLRGIGRDLTYKILQRAQSCGLWRRVVCR